MGQASSLFYLPPLSTSSMPIVLAELQSIRFEGLNWRDHLVFIFASQFSSVDFDHASIIGFLRNANYGANYYHLA